MRILLCVSFAAVTLVGCRSALTAKSRVPVPVVGTNYVYGNGPSKTVVNDTGREYQKHLRELQRLQYEHERWFVSIEQKLARERYARTNGIPLPRPRTNTVSTNVSGFFPQGVIPNSSGSVFVRDSGTFSLPPPKILIIAPNYHYDPSCGCPATFFPNQQQILYNQYIPGNVFGR